ncbi:MAG: AAA family ATPase, partial [Bacteroidota bacterium]|nr:AAA family ATPase [Bacteroidota bacterium]
MLRCFYLSFLPTHFHDEPNFKIEKLSTTTVFFGDNNVGKSNILHALYTVFKRKRKINRDTVPFKLTEPQNFYEGVVENFNNNFFGNIPTEITFEVEFTLDVAEVCLEKPLLQKLTKKTETKHKLVFAGNIIPVDSTVNLAEIMLRSVELDSQSVYTYDRKANVYSYFPTLDKLRRDQSNLAKSFSHLVEPFNDCVALIESARDMHPTDFSLEPVQEIDQTNFKRFLHSLYLSEDSHRLYEQINSVFNREPFSFGAISFASVNGKLEVMVKENDLRLPIKHVGSGVLQTLYIIAMVIHSKSKIVCIEELEQNLAPPRQYPTLAKLQSMLGDNKVGSLRQLIVSSHSSVYAKPKLGTIYLLEKENAQTKIKEVLEKKFKEGMKKHLIDSALPPDTYSPEEYQKNFEQLKKLEHDRLQS